MLDYAPIASFLHSSLDVRTIAISYLDAAPDGIPPFSGTVPSGCSFWALAASRGSGFYTVPADHLNCPIGSYAHAIDLPPERAPELEQVLSFMTGIGYIRLEEVPSIPRLPRTPAFTAYSPLSAATIAPDVVVATGRPGPLMQLQEACVRAGAASQLPLLGRPTCMALPAAMGHGSVMSSGCVGNRVYTDLKDEELYLMIPGARIAAVVDELRVILSANAQLESYHRGRRESLTAHDLGI